MEKMDTSFIQKLHGYRGSHIGYYIKIQNDDKFYYKYFKFANFSDPLKEAINFRDNDPEIKELFNKRKLKIKSRNMQTEESFQFYLNKYKIKTFPKIIKNAKIVGIDYIDGKYVFIKECNICKKHVNDPIRTQNVFGGHCRNCVNNIKRISTIYEYTHKKPKYESIVIGTQMNLYSDKISKSFFKSEISISKNKATKELIDKYKLYFNYILYDFIITYDLKYRLPMTKKKFLELKKVITKDFLPRFPKIKINYDLLNDNRNKKQLHIFTAKIQGFGTNKKDESKTVLLNEVEYVGIDNFRDHMWTQFTKELDLPIGTTIKFKGEIYDYEREYLGTREVDKNGQAIKIIDLLEVDLSTRERVKLYK